MEEEGAEESVGDGFVVADGVFSDDEGLDSAQHDLDETLAAELEGAAPFQYSLRQPFIRADSQQPRI